MNQAQGQIQTQLQRRADLIPNLVNTVKGVTKQEDTVFISIANARSRLGGAIQSRQRPGDGRRQPALNQGLGRLHRDLGELSPAPLERELQAAAGPARGHREPDLRGPAGLQRRRGRVQRLYPPLSLQPHRQDVRAGQAARRTSRRRPGRRRRRRCSSRRDGRKGEGDQRQAAQSTQEPRGPCARPAASISGAASPPPSVYRLLASVRHHLLRQHVPERIHRPAVHVHLVVQVRAGGEAGVADQCDALAPGDPLACRAPGASSCGRTW